MGRNDRLHKMLGLIESETTSDSEIILVMDLFDVSSPSGRIDFDCLTAMHPKVKIITTNIRGCWRCTNVGIEAAKYDFIMWTADDALPHSGWFWNGVQAFRSNFPDGLGLLILNDLAMGNQIAGHAMTTKRFMTVLFGEPKFPEGFSHLFCDTMIADWAKDIGRGVLCERSILEHMHWRYEKSMRDATNIMCESRCEQDKGF